ncbi:MAG: SDR family NAD(P)-dependent oxidoreductase [Alphaproteobacteria bacterium]
MGRAPSLAGKAALVTGASAGLGRRMATVLAAHGAAVAIAARRRDRLDAVAAEIAGQGGRAVPVLLDTADPASIEAAVTEAETALGPLHILVNNAATQRIGWLMDQDEADWDALVDTNVKGCWLMSRAVARRMTENGTGGSIVNISSLLAFRHQKMVGAYGTTKAAIVHLTQAMALEWAQHGIRVNGIAPGNVITDMTRDYLTSPHGQGMIPKIPLRRFGEPEDMDGPLLLLAGEGGRYMTGVVIPVDGGHTLSLAL